MSDSFYGHAIEEHYDFVVIDIETLGLTQDSPVISIGFARYLRGHVEDHTIPLKFQEQIRSGRRVDQDTLAWWMRQSDQARESTFLEEKDCFSLTQANHTLKRHIDACTLVYGDLPSLDLALVRAVFEESSLVCPWNYRQERCARTVRAGRSRNNKPLIPHNPGSDAHAALLDIVGWLDLPLTDQQVTGENNG